MIKSVTFNAGHTLSGGDTGAEGYKGYKEQVLTRKLVQMLIEECKNRGISTHISRVDYAPDLNTSLNEQVRICNSYNVDMNVCIHFNASNGQGNGTEIFTYGGKEVPEARRILNNMEKLGFQNRGIKNAELALINNTVAETIYIEVCFIDNVHDMQLYLNNLSAVVGAIVNGLLNCVPSTPSKPINKEDIMEKIVLYFGDADAFSAILVAQKNKCPMMKVSDFNEQKLKAKQVIQIGGKPNTNRFDSLKEASKLV